MIDEIYTNAIRTLSTNSQIHLKIDEEKIQSIIFEFNQRMESSTDLKSKKELLKKYFFILAHATHTSKLTHESLIKAFDHLKNLKLETDYYTFLLAAVQKQFIDHQSRSGDQIPFELLLKLKELLTSANSEILEWTLRIIEALGPQSLHFQKEILSLKPSIFKIFSNHQRHSFEIIDLLQKNWSRFKK